MIPILNDKPKYDMKVPSTGKSIRYRPYLVKEEKVLLMAFESKDEKASMKAVIDTIMSCVYDDLNPNDLHLFDVEYMFTKIRGKSTGEIVEISAPCQECETNNEVSLNIDEVKVNGDFSIDSLIDLGDKISVEMAWPKYNDMILNEAITSNENEVQRIIEMTAQCIISINTENNSILVKDEPRDQLMKFIESMTNEQFTKVREYLDSMPVCEVNHSFKCSHCGAENELNIRNITDFF